MNKIVALILFTCLTMTSCGLAYKVLLGIDSTPEWNSDDDIIRQAKKYDIASQFNLVLDTASYDAGLREIYRKLVSDLDLSDKDSTEYFSLKEAWSDDSQPVQFRLFDSQGVEIFKLVNCYVDPPIPMNWNVENCFDVFPPQVNIESLNSHNFDLEFLLSYSSYLDGSKLQFSDLPMDRYYAVITWNEFFKRPSKKLINEVKEYIKSNDQSKTLIYINNQNATLWSMMDSEMKEYVKEQLASGKM